MNNDLNPGQTPGGKNMTNVLLACCAVLLAAILIMIGVMFASNRSSTTSGMAATQPAGTDVKQDTASDAKDGGKDAEADDSGVKNQDGTEQTAEGAKGAEDAKDSASQSGKESKDAAKSTSKESASKDATDKKDASGVASASESKSDGDKTASKQSEERGQSSSQTLPRRWYGEYVGVFAYADGTEYTTTRRSMLVLDESYVDGPVTGIMYLDYGTEGEESYYVEGYYDSSSRELEVWWTEWIERKGTQSTREFTGVVSRDYTTIDGETVTTKGEHWSSWDSYAE